MTDLGLLGQAHVLGCRVQVAGDDLRLPLAYPLQAAWRQIRSPKLTFHPILSRLLAAYPMAYVTLKESLTVHC
jgi:hypothetical protein